MENQPTHINERKVRAIAFVVLLLGLLYLLIPNPLIPILLVLDFGLRSFDLGKYSPLATLSDAIINYFKLPAKPIFYPPKRFATRIGLVFSLTILALHLTSINAQFIVGILVLFAALESLAGICAGCYVYNWLQPILQKFDH
ncbi:MAG: DUF4395 domain-containing protein [Bacteroidota bacterium]|jgi:hypothetical protein